MQNLTELRLGLAVSRVGERLLWEGGLASSKVATSRQSRNISWRPGSNAGTVEGKDVLRWERRDGARYAVLASPFGNIVWMAASLPATSDAVNISFSARDLTGRECCVPVVYAGHAEPRYPAFFTTDFEPIASNWRGYRYMIEIPRPIVPPPVTRAGLLVAIGFADPYSERAQVPVGHMIGLANILVSRA